MSDLTPNLMRFLLHCVDCITLLTVIYMLINGIIACIKTLENLNDY